MARHIIKHANRRLYDVEQRRVITLLELSNLVAAGVNVSVELKETGEDITAVTLLQSVLERVKLARKERLGSLAAERLEGAVRRAIDSLAQQGADEYERDLEESGAGLPATGVAGAGVAVGD